MEKALYNSRALNTDLGEVFGHSEIIRQERRPQGRGMLAVFAEFERDILRDRVKAGIAQARQEGRPHGRPPTVHQHTEEIKSLFTRGISKRQIAARLSISRASVRRTLLRRIRATARQRTKGA